MTAPGDTTHIGSIELRDVARLTVARDELLVIRADLDPEMYEHLLGYLQEKLGQDARVLILDSDAKLDVIKYEP